MIIPRDGAEGKDLGPKPVSVTLSSGKGSRSVVPGRSEVLIVRNEWTNGTRRPNGRIEDHYSDLSTRTRVAVDLSPGWSGGLWITFVDAENPQVAPERERTGACERTGALEETGAPRRRERQPRSPSPGRAAQNRPSWQRATQSAAETNSSSDVPGGSGRTSSARTCALGYDPR